MIEEMAAQAKPKSITFFIEYFPIAHPKGMEAKELAVNIMLFSKPN
jgi:hypothetical protein